MKAQERLFRFLFGGHGPEFDTAYNGECLDD